MTDLKDVSLFQGPRKLVHVLYDVKDERRRQDAKWGEQNHPDGTGEQFKWNADQARARCDQAARDGHLTWRHILKEETWEAFAESDPARLRVELVQVMAVAAAWIEHLDRRAATEPAQAMTDPELGWVGP